MHASEVTMTIGQNAELVGAYSRLLCVSPEVAKSIINDLHEDAEIAHFHLATFLNLVRSADQSLRGIAKEL